MRPKNLLCISLMGMLLVSVMHISSVSALLTTMYIDPPIIENPDLGPGMTFTVDISVGDVVGLYGWEFKLYYLTAVLTATGVFEGPFLKAGGTTFFGVHGIDDDYNATHGRVWAYCTLLGVPEGVDGSGVLATVEFSVDAVGETPLALRDTKLSDQPGLPIEHNAVDGYFNNLGPQAPVAIFTWTPESPTVGEIVTFDASASHDPDGTIVSYAWDYGDATSDSGEIVTHAYSLEGTYTVTLTVTDDEAATDTATDMIIVVPPPPPPIYLANLVRKSAWPEHHHFDVSKDEDGNQTLFGKVRNLGTATTAVKVAFTIQDQDGTWSTTVETDTATIVPGEIIDVSYNLDPETELPAIPGKYYVSAQCYYEDETYAWVLGEKIKSFSFAVVP